jgi:hypothetical protein
MSLDIANAITHGSVVVYPQEQDFIDTVVMGSKFPWFWKSGQDFNTDFFYNKHLPEWLRPQLAHYNSQFFSHTLLKKAEHGEQSHLDRSTNDFSVYYEFFIELFHRFMSTNNIKYSKIYRANLNLNWYNDINHTEPHLDHEWPHCNFIMYLNTCEAGETLIWPDDFSTTHSIPCVQNTAVAFKQEWHAHRYPAPKTRRIVFVVTYI